MKKYLLLLLISISICKVYAQNCNCTVLKNEEIYVETKCDSGCIPINGRCDPCKATDGILIKYSVVNCNGSLGILFKNAIWYGNRYQPTDSSNYQNNQWEDYKEAQQTIMNMWGAQSTLSFVYPASCKALASVTYPRPSPCYFFVPEGPQQGQIHSIVDLGNPSPIYQSIDCETENCCSLNYQYNAATGRFHLQLQSPNVQFCNGTPPQITVASFTCLDANGNEVTYVGNVNYVGECFSICGSAFNTLFKTSSNETYKSMPDIINFKAYPIPVKDKLYFNNFSLINNIEFFDISGKKVNKFVFEKSKGDGHIVLNDIEEGIYIVRLWFDDLTMRSLKIVKTD